MRTTIGLVLTVALGACFPVGWEDVPGAKIRPVNNSENMTDEGWTAEVFQAVRVWNDGLVDLGCEPPFDEDPVKIGHHPVIIVDDADWQHGAERGGKLTSDDWVSPAGSIEIKYSTSWRLAHQPILLHELGHALGLEHVDDRPSVMSADSLSTGLPYPLDFEDAAEALGCVTVTGG